MKVVRPFLYYEMLFANAFEFDELTKPRNDHAFGYLRTTRKNRFIACLSLSIFVVPDLAVRTFTVPAKVTI